MLGAVAMGFGGVALLLFKNGDTGIATVLPRCVMILGAGVAWSLGADVNSHGAAPKITPADGAGGAMMPGASSSLVLSRMSGEINPLPVHSTTRCCRVAVPDRRWLSHRVYAARMCHWLLARMPATRVASHARM